MAKKDVKLFSSEQVYSGPAFTVHTDYVKEGRKQGRRDIIRHTGSVVILAAEDGQKKSSTNNSDRLHSTFILLIQQYRHAPGEVLWELPAGRVDPGENKLAAAKRELIEETGVHAKRWQKAFSFWASPGFLAESMTVFLARGLSLGEAHPEEDEQIHVRFVSLAEAVTMVMSNRIRDAKTMCGVLWFARKLDAETHMRVVRKRK
jgi:ADP-ribose pyrophosphatase